MQCRRRGGTKQRHLQTPILLQLESIVYGNGLGDSETDLFTAVIHASPLRIGTVAGEVGREVGGGVNVGPFDEHRHRANPRDDKHDADRPRDRTR